MKKGFVFFLFLTFVFLPIKAEASTARSIQVSITIPERAETARLPTRKDNDISETNSQKNTHQSKTITRNGRKIILETVTVR